MRSKASIGWLAVSTDTCSNMSSLILHTRIAGYLNMPAMTTEQTTATIIQAKGSTHALVTMD